MMLLLPSPQYTLEEILDIRTNQLIKEVNNLLQTRSKLELLSAEFELLTNLCAAQAEELLILRERTAMLALFHNRISNPETLVALESVEYYLAEEFPSLHLLRSAISQLASTLKEDINHDS